MASREKNQLSHRNITRVAETRNVLLLIETTNGYSRGLLEGVLQYVRDMGHWMVCLAETERGRQASELEKWSGDGIIARIETQEIAAALKKFDLPIVDLSATQYLKGVPWTSTDDKLIAEMGFQHFAERGFHHFAFVGDHEFVWSNNRCQSFKKLVKQTDAEFFEFQSTHRFSRKFSWERNRARLCDWLVDLPRPIAIMASYDYLARAVLSACRELEILVPQEMAVLGVDDDCLICELTQPPLSSIIQDTCGVGYQAAVVLDDLINRRNCCDKPASSRPIRESREDVDTVGGCPQASSQGKQLLIKPVGVAVRESTDIVAVDDPEIAAAVHEIRRNAGKKLQVGDLLGNTTVSRRAFEYRFRQAVGRTPHEEIKQAQLRLIKNLLVETSLPVDMIAKRVGFKHGEYMASVFRQATGQTPTQYRKNQQEENL